MKPINTHEKFLVRAHYFAARSSLRRYKTGALIVNFDGSVVGEGWSHYSQLKLSNYRSIHAEVSAILRCGRKEWLNGSTIYIVTIRQSGNNGLAYPCKHCLALLHEVGVKQIIYTTGQFNPSFERVFLK